MELEESNREVEAWRGFDYRSQLYAIRTLLVRQRRAEAELEREIEEFAEFARNSTGGANTFAMGRWTDLVIDSVFQGAAHSMASVGMLAPITESAFKDAFRKIGITIPLPESETGGLVADIMKCAREVGMVGYLPGDLRKTLEALFEYRNKMFHFGFEWPLNEAEQFERRIKSWPENWFVKASQGNLPWTFWMSSSFVDHCVSSVEMVINGLSDFLVDQLRRRFGVPALGLQEHALITNFQGFIGNELLEP